MIVKFQKTILKSDGMKFDYHSESEKNPSGAIVVKIKARVLVCATIDRKKNTIVYYWDIMNRFKLGTIDNLLHRIDCLLKNQRPNP